MKKLYFSFGLCLSFLIAFTKQIPIETAQKVASNFFKLNTRQEIKSININYTETLNSSVPYIYIFNINSGFVVVSADDRGFPVLGYSSNNHFSVKNISVKIWINKRAEELKYAIEHNIAPTLSLTEQWNKLSSNNINISEYKTMTGTFVLPLLQTQWNQSPYYNALCPGGSVTGCVATAMAQIMRYWCYPSVGNGSSSYTHPTYGYLSANYGTTTYTWSAMPPSISSPNMAVAIINYHCGVSVEMDYSPSASGAWVCAGDNPICAQTSYTNYFRYDPALIQDKYRMNYPIDANWISLLKNDLNLSRPIQYAGWDLSAGGHTWVCDGYDVNDFFHMNWGWGGASDGYFNINNLNGGGYNFGGYNEALVGIVPLASTSLDASIANITGINPVSCSYSFTPTVRLQNFGSSVLTNCFINYKLDNGTVATYTWTGSLSTGLFTFVTLPTQITTSGNHTLTCFSSNPNSGIDGNTTNDAFSTSFSIIQPNTPLPFSEGFENNAVVSANWGTSSSSGANNWQITNSSSATGIQSFMVNNITNSPGNVSWFQSAISYDFSTYSNPMLTFKVAYQRKNASGIDNLQVLVSTNCGATWLPKWGKSGGSLATNTLITSVPFIAAPSDFITYTVNLGSAASSNNVLLMWKFTADATQPGNNIYIDDINITSIPTSVQNNNNPLNEISIIPNPTSQLYNIVFYSQQETTANILVYDIAGKIIEQHNTQVSSGQNNISMGQTNQYAKGMYFVKILTANGLNYTTKLLIE